MHTRIAGLAFAVLAFSLAFNSSALAANGIAQVPAQPNAPAATLLLPYFEVDLDNADGMSTLFSVNNASATAVLARVTIWSDLGLPVFGFNVYLTGYDVQTISLRDVLTGTVPRTASDGRDQQDTISPQGPFSQDINFASCNQQLPPPAVPASYVSYMQAALTGQPSAFHGGQCFGRDLGTPRVARGYVTVDTVNNCTLRFPGDPGYFGPGGTGDVTNQNVLWGDYFYLNPSQELAYGDPLVHIRADATDPDTSTGGNYTFYGRLTGWTAADNREPLSTNFATRFVSPKDFKEENKAKLLPLLPPATELVVWRDPKTSDTEPFACAAGGPSWFPLGQEHLRAFNEQENSESLSGGFAAPFPGATQRVPFTPANFPVTFDSGWLFMNLNTTVADAASHPKVDPAAAQAWVTTLHRVLQGPHGGRYDVGFRAVRLDTARDASHFVIGF